MDPADDDTLFLDLHSLTTRKWTSHLNVSLTTLHFFFSAKSKRSLGWMMARHDVRQRAVDWWWFAFFFVLGKFYVVERLLLSPRKKAHILVVWSVSLVQSKEMTMESTEFLILQLQQSRESSVDENRKKKSWWWSTIDSQRHGIFVSIECGWERKKKQQLTKNITTKKRDTYISCENWEYHSGKTMKFTSCDGHIGEGSGTLFWMTKTRSYVDLQIAAVSQTISFLLLLGNVK